MPGKRGGWATVAGGAPDQLIERWRDRGPVVRVEHRGEIIHLHGTATRKMPGSGKAAMLPTEEAGTLPWMGSNSSSSGWSKWRGTRGVRWQLRATFLIAHGWTDGGALSPPAKHLPPKLCTNTTMPSKCNGRCVPMNASCSSARSILNLTEGRHFKNRLIGGLHPVGAPPRRFSAPCHRRSRVCRAVASEPRRH